MGCTYVGSVEDEQISTEERVVSAHSYVSIGIILMFV